MKIPTYREVEAGVGAILRDQKGIGAILIDLGSLALFCLVWGMGGALNGSWTSRRLLYWVPRRRLSPSAGSVITTLLLSCCKLTTNCKLP